jgi:N-acetylneuraminic acid mutarotase
MGQSVVVDPVTGRLIMFGGAYADNPAGPSATAHAYNDLWSYEFASNTWSELQPSGTLPSARMEGQVTYDAHENVVFLFGGIDDSTYSGTVLGDLWKYEVATNRWTKLQPAGRTPSPRFEGSMTYDPANHTMLLFGGNIPDDKGGKQLLNDLWEYDPSANVWTELQPSGATPEPRRYPWLAIDPVTGRLLLFGGEVKASKPSGSIPLDTAATNELWTYDRQNNTWTKLKPKGAELPRTGCFVYDEDIRQFMLIAGSDQSTDGQIRLETWSWDPTSNLARKLSPQGTHPLWNGFESFVYSPQKRQVLAFGGSNALAIAEGAAKPPAVYYQGFSAWSPQ